jgi:hypothetical protein
LPLAESRASRLPPHSHPVTPQSASRAFAPKNCTNHLNCYQLRKARQDEFFLQRRIEVLESKIKLAIGENLGIKDIVSWEWRPGFRIDIDKLRKQRPQLYKLLLNRFEADLSGRRCKWA